MASRPKSDRSVLNFFKAKPDAQVPSLNGDISALLDAVIFERTKDGVLLWSNPERALTFFSSDDVPHSETVLSTKLSAHDSEKRRETLKRSQKAETPYDLHYTYQAATSEPRILRERGFWRNGMGCGVIVDVTQDHHRLQRAHMDGVHHPLSGALSEAHWRSAVLPMRAFARRQGWMFHIITLEFGAEAEITAHFGPGLTARFIRTLSERIRTLITADQVLGHCERSNGADNQTQFRLAFMLPHDQGGALSERLSALESQGSSPFEGSDHPPIHPDMTLTHWALAPDESLDIVLGDDGVTPSAASFVPSGGVAEPLAIEVILEGLKANRFCLALQPIMDAQSQTAVHFEALIRLKDETGQIIPPIRFVPVAERMGLIDLIDQRTLLLAHTHLKEHPDQHVAINISAGSLQSADKIDTYLDGLKALGADASRLILELTETVAAHDTTLISDFATRAKALGCRFAIDDFGAGHTSFANLMAIEADMIKIDGRFIDDLLRSDDKQTFVRMMIDLAQTFGVKTVAERIEDEPTAAYLTHLGVDYLQGYYFGQPKL